MATLLWILIGVAIIVLEAYALLSRTKGDTLSEVLWRFIAYHRLLRIGATLFWVWLGLHLFGPRGWY